MKSMICALTAALLFSCLSIGVCAGGEMRCAAADAAGFLPSPAEPFTWAELTPLLGSGAVPASTQTVSRSGLCRALYAYLTEQGLVLPQSDETDPVDVGYATESCREVLYICRGGVMSCDEGGYFHPDSPVTAGEAALALGRLRMLSRPYRDAQPAGSLPESEARPGEYLADACVLGHSIAVGLQMTCRPAADFIAQNGISAVGFLSTWDIDLPSGESGSVIQGLAEKSYGKIYLLLGTNDMPGGPANLENFRQAMENIISVVREYQPQAQLYILSLTPVGSAVQGYLPFATPDYLAEYNQVLKSLSRRYGVPYLDVYTPLCDAQGYLRGEYDRGDGIHLSEAGYQLLLDCLLTHTVTEVNS